MAPGSRTARASLGFIAAFIAMLGAGCNRYWVCGEVESRMASLPGRLSETGLYADIATGELAPGVVPFTPRFPLWSDGSEKQRWILLPGGAQIDKSDMDEWVFPEGTKVWKQFSLGGVRIETRLLAKAGPTDADWTPLAYVWDADGADAIAAPLGAIDSHHTDHDVPAAGECFACHGGRRSFILGYSAVQLGDVVVPGNAIEVAALGYFHGNCSHCHNQTRPERGGARCFDPRDGYDFTLAVGRLDATGSTPTYQTVVGDAVKRGDPDGSRLFELVSSRGFFRQMPPLATEKVDASAVANIRAWIEGL